MRYFKLSVERMKLELLRELYNLSNSFVPADQEVSVVSITTRRASANLVATTVVKSTSWPASPSNRCRLAGWNLVHLVGVSVTHEW